MSKQLEVNDNPQNEFVEIEGIKYSYEVFKGLGGMLKLNEPFVIRKREDGVLTIYSEPFVVTKGKKE